MSQVAQSPAEPILKPRDLGQLLDQSFKVFGRYWKPLLLVGIVSALPNALVGMVGQVLFPTEEVETTSSRWLITVFLAAEAGDYSGIIALLTGFGLVLLALLLLWPLFEGAIIDVATRAVLHMEPVPLSESLRVGARRYGALLGTSVLKWLLFIVAVPVAILAGLFVLAFVTVPLGLLTLAVFTAFSQHAIIVEGLPGGIPALKRSYELGKYRFWPLMGIGIVFHLLVQIVQGVITAPFSLAAVIGTVFIQSPGLLILNTLVGALASGVGSAFLMVGLTLTYFDTRIRREGYDLEVMVQRQPTSGPGDVAPPPGAQS